MTVHARHRIESSLAEGLQADFTLDVVGNISAIAGAGGAPVNGYSYDDLYRLTSESAPALSLAHAYDATGNRTAETVAGATTVYAYPPDSHRLTNLGGTERTFDAAGNLRVVNRSNRSSPEYAYDDRNRLAAYRVGGQDVATYAHNARGERVLKQAPKAGSATLFVYAEGGQLLGEYDGDGNVLQEYAWLDALPVAVLKKSGPYPIEPDHLGTPRRAIAAELDRAVWAWDLQGPAFGTHAANDDPDADGQPFPLNLRFPGQYLDAESGLHYNYFRDYDPVTGRYVESDPVGLRAGPSTFGYVSARPMYFVDTLGLGEARDRAHNEAIRDRSKQTGAKDSMGSVFDPWAPNDLWLCTRMRCCRPNEWTYCHKNVPSSHTADDVCYELGWQPRGVSSRWVRERGGGNDPEVSCTCIKEYPAYMDHLVRTTEDGVDFDDLAEMMADLKRWRR